MPYKYFFHSGWGFEVKLKLSNSSYSCQPVVSRKPYWEVWQEIGMWRKTKAQRGDASGDTYQRTTASYIQSTGIGIHPSSHYSNPNFEYQNKNKLNYGKFKKIIHIVRRKITLIKGLQCESKSFRNCSFAIFKICETIIFFIIFNGNIQQ